jgi:hypothetical protein
MAPFRIMPRVSRSGRGLRLKLAAPFFGRCGAIVGAILGSILGSAVGVCKDGKKRGTLPALVGSLGAAGGKLAGDAKMRTEMPSGQSQAEPGARLQRGRVRTIEENILGLAAG